ncbi:MAG TPA: hypothetical protein VN706_04905 [Gemmatimonadaceae bacterium]|nr:hypothetical protein [Gemmatimonadaceae bacterium]
MVGLAGRTASSSAIVGVVASPTLSVSPPARLSSIASVIACATFST